MTVSDLNLPSRLRGWLRSSDSLDLSILPCLAADCGRCHFRLDIDRYPGAIVKKSKKY